MSKFEFIPTEQQTKESNIHKFMKQYWISSLEELSEKSKNDLEWYWKAVSKDVGIVWNSPYSKILDSSKGIMWSKWFVNGKTNIYTSSVEKFVKKMPDKVAYHFVSEDNAVETLTYLQLDQEVSKSLF